MKLLYVAGPYRSPNGGVRGMHKNIEEAADLAYDLWQMGAAVICPHKNTALFDGDAFSDASLYLAGDLEMLRRCDAIVLLPTWEKSEGAKGEKAYAEAQGIKVFYWPTDDSHIQHFINLGRSRED